MRSIDYSSDDGFSLIELLVVIAIIGILATVALTQYALYKQMAVDSDMQSTLHVARGAMEAYYVQNGTYVGADVPGLFNFGYRQSTNVTLSVSPPPTDVTYGLMVCSPGGTTPAYSFTFSGGSGTIAPSPGPCT